MEDTELFEKQDKQNRESREENASRKGCSQDAMMKQWIQEGKGELNYLTYRS